MLVVLALETLTPASGILSLAVQVYSPPSLVCSGESDRMRVVDDSDTIGKLSPSLVHVSVGVARMPFCVDAEQTSVNGCPAILELL